MTPNRVPATPNLVDDRVAALATALDELDPRGSFWDHVHPDPDGRAVLLKNAGLAARLAAALDAATPDCGHAEEIERLRAALASALRRAHMAEYENHGHPFERCLDPYYVKARLAIAPQGASDDHKRRLEFFCAARGHGAADWCSAHGDIPRSESISHHIQTVHDLTYEEYRTLWEHDARIAGLTLDEQERWDRSVGIAALAPKGASDDH